MLDHIILFLSHIDEEKELALLLKDAIEKEFSGFVTVFSFADEDMNPSGGNIISNIETHLRKASAGIFLISPLSLRRPWINFELGALWMRNVIPASRKKKLIPVIPFCHSGSDVGNLPKPLGDLNAITANNAAHLRRAFKSLQRAAGGHGELRTDFSTIAQKIGDFERHYTIGTAFQQFWSALLPDQPFSHIIKQIDQHQHGGSIYTISIDGVEHIKIDIGEVEQINIDSAMMIVDKKLKNVVDIRCMESGTNYGMRGAVQTATVRVLLNMEFYRSIRDSLDRLMRCSAF